MRPLSINNRYISTSINNNAKFIFFGLILIIYFAWMDIALFVNLQRWSPPPILNTPSKITLTNPQTQPLQVDNSETPNADYIANNNNNNDIIMTNRTKLQQIAIINAGNVFTVFKPLSVKLIMIDHMTHYVHDILGRFIEDTLHFTSLFPWMTANFVSFSGLFLALVGSRLIISDNLTYMRIGALLFEMRNLADSLDGIVARSWARREKLESLRHMDTNKSSLTSNSLNPTVYKSNYGSFGYNVDVVCDGLGGLFLMVAILIKYLKHLPLKNTTPKLLRCRPSSGASESGYKYLRLDNDKDDKETLIQMENPTRDRASRNSQSDYYSNDDSDDTNLNEKKRGPSPTSSSLADGATPRTSGSSSPVNELSCDQYNRHVTSRQVKLVVISYGIRLAFTGLLWDHFVHKYHDLLMEFSMNPNQRRMQGQAFKSIGMWLVMWFWRLGNACAMLEHLTITTFFNKLWDYLYFSTYIGWAYLLILTLFTQIHYTELYESLNSFSALA